MFSFLQTALLWGIPLAALPWVIHFFNRKRAVPVRFPATEFILRSLARAKRHLQFKAWLLFLTRTLVLLALLFYLAGLQRGRVVAAGATDQEKSVVLMLDQSASLQAVAGDKPLFEEARRQALDLVKDLQPEDEAGALFFDVTVAGQRRELTLDHDGLRDFIRTAEAGFGATSVGPAVTEGLHMLAAGRHGKKELHIFTDRSRNGWDAGGFPAPSAAAAIAGLKIVVHDVQPEEKPLNRSLRPSAVRRDPADRTLHQIESVIDQSGGEAGEVAVRFLVDDKEVMRGFPRSNGPGLTPVTFAVKVASGAQIGTLRLPADPLPFDNDAFAFLEGGEAPRVLLVDGDPQPDPTRSETFFLSRALEARLSEQSGFVIGKRTLEEFTLRDLEEAELVVLANVPTLSAPLREGIQSFVRRGGKLLVTLGDRVEPDHYNQLFGELLPARLRDLRSEEGGMTLQALPRDDAWLRDISRADLALFEMPRFNRYVVVEAALDRNTKILARFSSGSPALLTKPVGKGRVALWTTSIDRAWNQFPLQPTFLPFVHAFVFDLARGYGVTRIWSGIVGEPVFVAAEDGVDRISLRTPKGKELLLEPEIDESGRRGATVADIRMPGPYAVQFLGPKAEDLGKGWIFVQIDSRESNLEKIPLGEMEKLLPADVLQIDEPQEKSGGSRANVSLAPLLAVGLLALLLLEGIFEWA